MSGGVLHALVDYCVVSIHAYFKLVSVLQGGILVALQPYFVKRSHFRRFVTLGPVTIAKFVLLGLECNLFVVLVVVALDEAVAGVHRREGVELGLRGALHKVHPRVRVGRLTVGVALFLKVDVLLHCNHNVLSNVFVGYAALF